MIQNATKEIDLILDSDRIPMFFPFLQKGDYFLLRELTDGVAEHVVVFIEQGSGNHSRHQIE